MSDVVSRDCSNLNRKLLLKYTPCYKGFYECLTEYTSDYCSLLDFGFSLVCLKGSVPNFISFTMSNDVLQK